MYFLFCFLWESGEIEDLLCQNGMRNTFEHHLLNQLTQQIRKQQGDRDTSVQICLGFPDALHCVHKRSHMH